MQMKIAISEEEGGRSLLTTMFTHIYTVRFIYVQPSTLVVE